MIDLKSQILASVDEELYHIEKALIDNLKPHFNLVKKVSSHILFSGGKRLRPLLMVLSARICDCYLYSQFKYSTMFEYLHAATLLHDDILDGAEMRHGNVVANYLWDYPTVLLIGDFLLARAISIAASTGKCLIVEIIANIAEKMSQGEICQLQNKKKVSLTEEEYLEIISCKTAIMFRGACKSGAIMAGANSAKTEALAQYGYNLGMAFQMADDLLDYVDYGRGHADVGKKPGMDLREGKLTMPVIFSINRASDSDRDKMCLIASSGLFSKSEFDWFTDSLEKYGGIEYTYQKAMKHIELAEKSLAIFGDNRIVNVLNKIATYALLRKV